jgi:N-methylhydantoinase A
VRTVERRAGGADRARTGTRVVCFEEWVETPIYWRADLGPDDRLTGPAIIEEFGSTIPVHPGFTARVDRDGNIVVSPAWREEVAP